MNLKFDKVYISTLLQIAVPIAVQNGINALLTMTDSLMVGQLGSTSVAAVALANQVAFLLTFFMYGVTSGAVAFTAQFWGKEDITSIRKVLGISMALSVLVAALFTGIAEFFPNQILSLYSEDQAVIELGAGYLRIVGASYLLTAVSFSFSAGMVQ
jgi:Na+-driven multidrug efflux pump